MKLIVLITKCLSYTNNEEEGKEPFTLYINKLLKEKYSKEDREKYDDAIKSFYQFNNKDILNSKNKKMCVTKEEVDEYRYELVLRNKYDLVVKNEGRFAYGTTKRNKEFFDESKVVIENIPSFSMKGSTNDKSENEEIIDTSTSSCANKRKTSRNQSKKKEKIEDKESEEEEEDHKKKEDNKKKAMSEKIDTDKVKSIDNPFTIMNYIYYIIDYTNRLKGLFSERQEKRTKAMKIETKRKRTRQRITGKQMPIF